MQNAIESVRLSARDGRTMIVLDMYAHGVFRALVAEKWGACGVVVTEHTLRRDAVCGCPREVAL